MYRCKIKRKIRRDEPCSRFSIWGRAVPRPALVWRCDLLNLPIRSAVNTPLETLSEEPSYCPCIRQRQSTRHSLRERERIQERCLMTFTKSLNACAFLCMYLHWSVVLVVFWFPALLWTEAHFPHRTDECSPQIHKRRPPLNTINITPFTQSRQFSGGRKKKVSETCIEE